MLSANIHHGTADPDALVALVDRYDPDLLSVQELTPSFADEAAPAGIASRLPEAMLLTHRSASGGRPLLAPAADPAAAPDPLLLPHAAGGDRSARRSASARRRRPPLPAAERQVGVWKGALESLPAAGTGTPWVLAGDFNATLDYVELRDLLDRGYRDAGDVTGKGLEPTWPTMGHRFMPPAITIDHVLADRRLRHRSTTRVEDLPGSDHRAIFAQPGLCT